MCGIAGVLDGRAEVVGDDRLSAACESMRPRGPDAQATWSGDGFGLAHTRLAIIDRAGGAQPMESADGRFVVVFNGEIYNHRDLRRELEARGRTFRTRSDTEVLLHLYAELGPAMVERLRGMFAFAAIDRLERRAVLARDRFGKKPLCYAQDGSRLAFASTLDALRPLLPRSPVVDPAALAEYLVLQYVPSPRAIWSGVRKLPPGHLAEWVDGELAVRAYWEPPLPAPTVERPEEEERRLRALVGEAVRIRLESEVPLGVFLSGGLDSSVVVAELAATGVRPSTYSVGFKDAAFDETRYAAAVAERFGTDHHVLVADDDPVGLFDEFARAYDEPFADSSALATLAVARAAREHVTVILTGDGGDELFGGYTRYAYLRRAIRLHARSGVFAGVAGRLAGFVGRTTRNARLAGGGRWIGDPWGGYRDGLFHFPPSSAAQLLLADVRPEARQALDALWRTSGGGVTGAMWVDRRTYLPEDLLVKMDRATMAHSLEARAPLLDHHLATFAAEVPEDQLFDAAGNGKALVRRAYSEVLPREILTRDKMGFGVPVASWLRGPLRPMVDELLRSPSGPLGAWLRLEGVRAVADRLLGGDDGAKWITWNLLALAGWARRRV